MLNETQLKIYNRQIMLPQIGLGGQEKLISSQVLICGVGGLGSPVALYLAAMGIGHIGLIDGDTVSLSNLNRQLLYSPADVGRLKVEVAEEQLHRLNPQISVSAYAQTLTEDNAARLISGFDIIVDCLDSLAARFILNDACILQDKPFVHAGVSGLSGQIMTVIPHKSPCLRCLLPGSDSGEEQTNVKGVLGATAGAIGSIQATEVFKYLLGLPLNDRGLLIYDGIRSSLQNITVKPDPGCFCQKYKKA